MTDFASTSDVVNALAKAGVTVGCRQDFYKTSLTAVAGFFYSGWVMAGQPIAGSTPSTWITPTQATIGCWVPQLIDSANTNRLLLTDLIIGNAGQQNIICDRLGHMGGLSGTSTSAQTVSGTLTTPSGTGRCNANGSDVLWFLEWYTATGSTAVTASVNVTYSDNSTGNVSVAVAASTPAYRMLQIISTSSNLSIKGVNTVTLSASTLTAGSFGVTALKRLASTCVIVANYSDKNDFAYLGAPVVGTDACLCMYFWTTATSLGIITGQLVVGSV